VKNADFHEKRRFLEKFFVESIFFEKIVR
jgi:hypothetical protein